MRHVRQRGPNALRHGLRRLGLGIAEIQDADQDGLVREVVELAEVQLGLGGWFSQYTIYSLMWALAEKGALPAISADG